MSEENHLILRIILAGTALVLLLAIFMVTMFVLHRQKRNQFLREKELNDSRFQQQLLTSRIEVQEQTFGTIAREIHDNVGQLLSSSRLLLGLAERQLGNEVPDVLTTANATLQQAITELRGLSHSLDPDWLNRFSFKENIQLLADRYNSARVVKLKLNIPEELNLPHHNQIMLFRVVQEAWQNAIKHARPDEISIDATNKNGNIDVLIINNGKGFNTEVINQSGIGMNSMRNRVGLLNGTIHWISSPGDPGTKVIIEIPAQP